MPMWGSQQRGSKSEVATSSLPCQAARTRAEELCNYCVLGGPSRNGNNIKSATSCLCSPGARRGRNRYVTPSFLGGGGNRGDKI